MHRERFILPCTCKHSATGLKEPGKEAWLSDKRWPQSSSQLKLNVNFGVVLSLFPSVKWVYV